MEAERRCDVVMKGGITSGIVYAKAVVELAKTYRLMNVAGTSAGAMAAAVAAACQRGALDGKANAFETLEGIPEWLGGIDKDGNTNLLRLFPPAKRTKPVFALLLAATTHLKATGPVEIALAALRSFRLLALTAALPGLFVIVGTFVAIAPGAGVRRTLLLFALLLCGVLLMVVGALAGAVGGLLWKMPGALKDTLYGTCPGSWIGEEPAAPPASDDGKPLTPWLSDLIDRAAGRSETGPPLTFGDLWGDNPAERDVTLQTFTTCLTLGRPFRVPFAADEQFYFMPSEWRRLFPGRVVDALAQEVDWRADPDTKLPLPPAAKLPVVVAARLSLSFPVLLSAIPLYDAHDGEHWFSDGGICSNFPLHFFDSPLPRWPTFGLDLQDTTDPNRPPVWMPDENDTPQPPPEQPVTDITSLGMWIVETAMDWHDNVTAALPGYRDRIATISFQPGEGGLNLNMSPDLIEKLGRNGANAGIALTERFKPGHGDPDEPVLSWDNHRWLRYRTALATVEPFLSKLLKGWLDAETLAGLFPGYVAPPIPPGQRSYAEIAADPPTDYAGLDPQQQELALAMTAAVVQVATDWVAARGADLPEPASPSLDFNAPTPLPDLRISPSQ
jgi:predicted acylesterase/phospholipase RssA